MTTMQRIIKYLALAFATFIIVTIASSIFWGVYMFSNVLNLRDSKNNEAIFEGGNAVQIYDERNTNQNILEIELKSSKLTIKNGAEFKVETNNKYVKCVDRGNGVLIKEEKHNFWGNTISETVVYMPKNKVWDKINIGTGAGEIYIENLNAKTLRFEMGAGKVTIGNLTVTDNCRIEGGAGQVNILTGKINNLKLDMGVGKFEMNSKLQGNSKISAGVGKLDIVLAGNKEDYKINVEKGIGSINIDGKSVSNESIYGSGEDYIKIDGGIGSIDIKFE